LRRSRAVFTGIIESIGAVASVRKKGKIFILTIDTSLDLSDTKVGDSVSVDGVCLTVVDMTGASFTLEATPETLGRSTLRNASTGLRVNLERALRPIDRLGGHLVQGHVEGIGIIRGVTRDSDSLIIRIDVEPPIQRYLVDKGSVAVDGISLTVNSLTQTGFTVNIIGHTEQETTLASKKAGSEVNIETDIIGKYIEKLLSVGKSPGPEGITLAKLTQEGYV
jgi:riboflavin synthase